MSYTQGKCQCWKVRFKVKNPSTWSAHCHCKQCQKIHGAPFSSWTAFQTQDYTIIDPDNVFKVYDSGVADRGFCSYCGSCLSFKYNKKHNNEVAKKYIAFTRTSIIWPVDIEPNQHIHYKERASWFCCSDTLIKRDD